MTFTSLPLSPTLSWSHAMLWPQFSLHNNLYFLSLYTNKHIGFLFPLSLAASLSGLWRLAQTQGWLLYKRVSGGRGAARESGEDAESQATGKNGLIRAVQHLRPQSNTTVLLHSSLFYITVFLSLLIFLPWLCFSPSCLSCSLLSFPQINCTETVVEEQSGCPWCTMLESLGEGIGLMYFISQDIPVIIT